MIIFRTAHFNGVEVYGGRPIPQKVKDYFRSKGARVARIFGFVIMYGNFSISSSDIASELPEQIKPIFGAQDMLGGLHHEKGAVAIAAHLDISFVRIISTLSFTNFGLIFSSSHLVVDSFNFSNFDIWAPVVDFTIAPIFGIFSKIINGNTGDSDEALNPDYITENIISPAEEYAGKMVTYAVDTTINAASYAFSCITPMFSRSKVSATQNDDHKVHTIEECDCETDTVVPENNFSHLTRTSMQC